jgi:hypothetical protein
MTYANKSAKEIQAEKIAAAAKAPAPKKETPTPKK